MLQKYQGLENRLSKDCQFEDRNIYVTEKIDGSQFSFQLQDSNLIFKTNRSIPKENDRNFGSAMIELKKITNFNDKYIYRGEVLRSEKHNIIKYNRHPNNYFILFDINLEDGSFLSDSEMRLEAERLNLEVVPLLFYGKFIDLDKKDLFSKESILGGRTEGIVIKSYPEKEDECFISFKIVKDDFKENTIDDDIDFKKMELQKFADSISPYCRKLKAVIHLNENGKLTGIIPSDLKLICQELKDDLLKECSSEIHEYCSKNSVEINSVLRVAAKDLKKPYDEIYLNANI